MQPQGMYVSLARERISGLSAAKGFTAAKLTAGVVFALCQVYTQSIYETTSGATPSATVGRTRVAREIFEVWGLSDLTAFRCIEVSASATLEVEYYGTPLQA